MAMQVRFYGVRGSIACAGPDTLRYGGNTSCVAVQAGDHTLVFDAGTGIRRLGSEIGFGKSHTHLFLSHLHWDHIQGFPFFSPVFSPSAEISIYGVGGIPHHDGILHDDDMGMPVPTNIREALAVQMRPPHFPVTLDMLRARLNFIDVPYQDSVSLGASHTSSVRVRHVAVDHPNGCVAYRVDAGGRSVVYATDLEHTAPGVHDAVVALAEDADVLIFDAQYTPEEYDGVNGPNRHGWGHSTYRAAADVALDARVKQLVLFHHDPAHNDDFLDRLGLQAQKCFKNVVVAQEGVTLSV